MKLAQGYKEFNQSNPIQTQRFGADPYAMEYNGRLYIYMTADAFEEDAQGNKVRNTYSKIRSIYVVSTDDMINFTDHGTVQVAGEGAVTAWAHNSWAPAAAWKMIDGKPKFFLYFADNGGGIGVLTADSPIGPFTDPLGHALVSRDVPNCANVLWLFDPAVLVDDDGTGYLYFGGGVPMGMAAAPGTGRVVRLGDDMISLACDPVAIDVPYLFEDSGIHKFNNRYYYTYCTNFNVDEEGTAKYGFHSGEISCMVSDSPMGPFKFQQMVLKNPGETLDQGGNNHHCVFNFLGKWYIVYHARTLENAMGLQLDYRSTHIDVLDIDEKGIIAPVKMTKTGGREQLKAVDAFASNSAVNVSIMAGTDALPQGNCSVGDMYLAHVDEGDYIEIQGVEFGTEGPEGLSVCAKSEAAAGRISFMIDDPAKEAFCTVDIPAQTSEFKTFASKVSTKVTGRHNLFLVCTEGADLSLLNWKAE